MFAMPKPTFAWCYLWTSLLIFGSTAMCAEPPVVEPLPLEPPPELAVLDPFVGSWGGDFQSGLTARHQCKWILNNQFLEIDTHFHWPGQAPASWRTLVSYDQKKSCYRMWRFTGTGEASTTEGAWDEQTTTLALTGRAPSGNECVTILKRIGDDSFRFEITEILTDEKRAVIGFDLARAPAKKDQQPTK